MKRDLQEIMTKRFVDMVSENDSAKGKGKEEPMKVDVAAEKTVKNKGNQNSDISLDQDNKLRRLAENILQDYRCFSGARVKPFEKNIKLVEDCLNLNNHDDDDLRDYISRYCIYKKDQSSKPDFEECMQNYYNYYHKRSSEEYDGMSMGVRFVEYDIKDEFTPINAV